MLALHVKYRAPDSRLSLRFMYRIAARSVVQAVAVWLPTISIVVTGLLLRDELPAMIATQWSGGAAGGWTPTILVFAVTAGISVVSAACAGHSERRRVWIAVGFSALSASAWLVLALVNLQPAPDVGGWGLLTPVAFLYGGLPAALTSPAPFPAGGEAEQVEVPDIARDWVISPVSCGLAFLTGAAAVVSVAAMQQAAVGIALAVVAVLAAEFSLVRIMRTATRLVVFGAVPGIPLYAIRGERVHSIERVDIRPFEWGGWGFRFGTSGAGIILRAGPGLSIRSRSGTVFTVSVQHPERFAGAHRPARNPSSAA